MEVEKRAGRSIQEIKEVFMIDPVLVILDLDREMRVEADTSDYTMGEVLLVKCEDEK